MSFKAIFVVYPADEELIFTQMKDMQRRVLYHGGTVGIRQVKMEKPRFGNDYYHEYTYRCDNMSQLIDY
jgi:hypothetical protein